MWLIFMLVIKLEIIVDSVSEHFESSCKIGVADLSTCDVEVTAALKSFKNKLDVYAPLASSRNYNVVIHADKREGCLNVLDAKKLVCNLGGNYPILGSCGTVQRHAGDGNALAVNSYL